MPATIVKIRNVRGENMTQKFSVCIYCRDEYTCKKTMLTEKGCIAFKARVNRL